MKRTILIDNDALARLTPITGVFDLMRNLYYRIEVPTKVKEEFEDGATRYNPERIPILNQLRPNSGFWSLCTQMDSLSVVMLFTIKGIDKGEAELISQGEKKNIRIIISDDGPFKKAADKLNKNFLIVSPLFIFASLDINEFLPNRISIIQQYYNSRAGGFSSRDLREAYQLALKEYGLNWTKKKLSEKTSLKKLGIT